MKVLVLALLALLMAFPARAKTVVADLSRHAIDVSVGFNGTEMLVFGALDEPADVAVVIEGPPVQAKLWRKRRQLGIWVNRQPVTYEKIPGFYAVAATRPVKELVGADTISLYGLSLESLDLLLKPGEQKPAADEGLKEAQRNRGHYQENFAGVTVLDGRLFRTTFALPDSVPLGVYKALIHVLKDGNVVATQTVPFTVRQTGLESSIYRLAYHRPFLYAFMALLASLGLGAVAAWLFRRIS